VIHALSYFIVIRPKSSLMLAGAFFHLMLPLRHPVTGKNHHDLQDVKTYACRRMTTARQVIGKPLPHSC
jgi:hypothetical protein